MITGLLHRIVARPFVYDLVQTAVGAKQVRRRLAERIGPVRDAHLVVDIGGGTGSVGALWSPSSKYVCLDIDPLKLTGFIANNPTGVALQADATRIPIADGSVDVVLCTNVTHHLTDPLLSAMIAESARVLRPQGKLILSDALWIPNRRVGRTMWHYDRGSFPRTAETIRAVVAGPLTIESWDQFAIWHEYFVCVAAPRGSRENHNDAAMSF
jgi:ubiquinone/menaquinone biosynthesis C-methylase UbiE